MCLKQYTEVVIGVSKDAPQVRLLSDTVIWMGQHITRKGNYHYSSCAYTVQSYPGIHLNPYAHIYQLKRNGFSSPE